MNKGIKSGPCDSYAAFKVSRSTMILCEEQTDKISLHQAPKNPYELLK